MENPASWGQAERVVEEAYQKWWKMHEQFVCGLSLNRMITEALRDAGLLNDEDEDEKDPEKEVPERT